MSTRTKVQIDRCSLFHWLTLCSFGVRTVTDTSKTTSYQHRRSSIKKPLGSISNLSFFQLEYRLLGSCFHNSLTDTRVKFGFSLCQTQLHTFVALLYFSIFFLSMIYQMLILMGWSFQKTANFVCSNFGWMFCMFLASQFKSSDRVSFCTK